MPKQESQMSQDIEENISGNSGLNTLYKKTNWVNFDPAIFP